jgi:uncharacterized membrane protein YfcA
VTLEPTTLALFAAVVFGGYVVQTVTGFGSTIFCVTFGALLVPIEMVPALEVPLSLVQNAWITMRYHDGIAWRLVLAKVVPLMLGGMIVGFEISEGVQGDALRVAFGVLVLVLSARELYGILRTTQAEERPAGPVATTTALLGAGVVHGIYATGGPLLVYAIGRLGMSKHAFRSTLTVIWLVLNAILTGMMAFRGRVSQETLLTSAMLFPTVPLGLVVGEVLHRRVSERRFKILLFSLLSIAAVTLVVH